MTEIAHGHHQRSAGAVANPVGESGGRRVKIADQLFGILDGTIFAAMGNFHQGLKESDARRS